MAQTYTLEEASQRLGITPEEFKRRLRDDWKSVRSFRDGATLRFRAADIDDLARAVGQASDPGLSLSDSGSPLSDSSEELLLAPGPSSGKKGKSDQPLFVADDSDDILALPSDSGSTKGKGKKGDSDVRLDLTPAKGDRNANQPTEEIDLDLAPPASGVGLGKSGSKSSGKLTTPKSSGRIKPQASKIPTPESSSSDDGSSEFELSLDSDSDSFELQLNNDSSEEVPLGAELPASPGGRSGINLGKPADSGVSIEKKKSKPPVDESDIDFELTADDGGAGHRTMANAPREDGSSEFELSLDDSSGSESMNTLASSVQASGDIFETDFELPAIAEDESGSEVVSVDSSDTDLENSDFDLAISDADAPADDDSASQVVLMDEDGEAEPVAARGKRSTLADADDDLDEVVEVDDAPIRTVAAAPPKWGAVPAVMLALTFPIVVLGGIMAFELVRGMAGYQQPNAASAPLVRGVAGMFGFKTGD